MAFISGRCPNCSGEIHLDDSKDKGFCLHCGSPVQVQEAVARLKVEHSGSVQLSGIASDQSLVEYGERLLETNPNEAKKKFEKALEINPENWKAWMNLAFFSMPNNACDRQYEGIKPDYFWNKEFISRDITQNDIKQANVYELLQHNAITVIKNHNNSMIALCGTTYLYYDPWYNKHKMKGPCEAHVPRWEQTSLTSKSHLENSIRAAPDSEKEYLRKMRERLFEYPRIFFEKLILPDGYSSMEEYRRNEAGCCKYCNAKLGFFSSVCKACGKRN